VGLLLFVFLIFLLFRIFFKEPLNTASFGFFALGSISGITATLVHSFFSYNFHNPSAYITFWALIAVLMSTSGQARITWKFIKLRSFAWNPVLLFGIILIAVFLYFSSTRVTADQHLANGKVWGGIISEYDKAVALFPYDPEMYAARADAFLKHAAKVDATRKVKMFDRSIKEFEKALRLRPNWPVVEFNMGIVHVNAGNDVAALKHFGAMKEKYPYFFEIRILAVNLTKKTKGWQAARRIAAADLKRFPESFSLNRVMGYILYEEKLFLESSHFFEKAAKIRPNDPDINNFAAASFFYSNKWKKARIYWKKAIELDPENKKYKYNLAQIS